jgi:hypothetical protein
MMVKMADGTDASMPATLENPKACPHSTSQAEGLGFPVLHASALVRLTTALITAMALGPTSGKETGETALLRTLFGNLKPGEVLLADRYYSGWWWLCCRNWAFASSSEFIICVNLIFVAVANSATKITLSPEKHRNDLIGWIRKPMTRCSQGPSRISKTLTG